MCYAKIVAPFVVSMYHLRCWRSSCRRNFTACWRGFQITRKRKNRSYNDGFVVVSSVTKDGAKHATLLNEDDSKLSSALLPSSLRLADDVPGVSQTVASASCCQRRHQPRFTISRHWRTARAHSLLPLLSRDNAKRLSCSYHAL